MTESLLRKAYEYKVAPSQDLAALPDLPLSKTVEGGRCIYEGYQRGLGLEFNGLNRHVWRDPLFRRAFAAARSNPDTRTVVTTARLMNLFLIIKFFLRDLDVRNIIEFGSFRGGSAIFMATLLKHYYPGARVYALDTFAGMPVTDPAKDSHVKGDFDTADVNKTRAAAAALGLDNVEFVQGLVEDTAPGVYERAGGFGLAHLDLDIYGPLKFCEQTVWPYITKGGYMVFDDATVSSCIGATQVVEELIGSRGIHSEQIWPHFVFRVGLE